MKIGRNEVLTTENGLSESLERLQNFRKRRSSINPLLAQELRSGRKIWPSLLGVVSIEGASLKDPEDLYVSEKRGGHSQIEPSG